MGHAASEVPPLEGESECDKKQREREERRSVALSNKGLFGCCYAPRKSEGVLTMLPRYRAADLTRVPGQFDTDSEDSRSDSDREDHRKVCFAPGDQEATLHEWIEEAEDAKDARRSADIDWTNLSEKVPRQGEASHSVSLPDVFPTSMTGRQRARSRRERTRRERTSSDMSVTSAASDETRPKWSKKDLEVWNPEHIKAVTLELFDKLDVGQKGRLSWRDGEVMAFVREFFLAHDCPPPPGVPSILFSTAYNQVKVESLPSHRDVDGLDLAETVDFVRRVYNFIGRSISYELAQCQSGGGSSTMPLPQREPVSPSNGMQSMPSSSSTSSARGPSVDMGMVLATV